MALLAEHLGAADDAVVGGVGGQAGAQRLIFLQHDAQPPAGLLDRHAVGIDNDVAAVKVAVLGNWEKDAAGEIIDSLRACHAGLPVLVLTDGDALMNLVAYWRDDVPEGWEPPADAASDRVAGNSVKQLPVA